MPIDCEDQELLEGFLTESTELLEKLDDDLVTLEKSPADTDLLNCIFRSIHTVKGASSFLGFDLLVKVTHKTEDVLNRLRKGELSVNPEIMDVILEAVDLVKLLLSDIKGGEIQERDIDTAIGKLHPYLSEAAVPPPPPEPAFESSPNTPVAAASDAAEAPVTESPVVEPTTGTQSSIPAPAIAPSPVQKPAVAKAEELADNSTVRVDVKRLDDLMNQVGELVLERNRMVQLYSDFQRGIDPSGFSDEFGKLTKRLNFVTSELQMQVLKMRMIPVEKVFKKFPRIVRNLARELNKDVELLIYGEETELDRSVVDEIGDPLIHLIRNALDHGLEPPEERIAAGKPPKGTVVLSANHEGNQIVISIKDNGRGINPDKVARKAIEKGLVTEEQLSAMSAREILDLIFLPGFSTKDKTTDLSGRGVGMDVVRTNIRKLNGIIEIKNDVGQGSEFILRLPLTLAIIQSLLVEVEGEIYSIPLSAVIETIKVQQSVFHQLGGQEVLKLRDAVLPLVRLHRLFGCRGDSLGRDTCYVVVVGVAEKRVGLVVSRLMGQQEVAIKSLGSFLANLPGIAGSTILGDGSVALIVDPLTFVHCSDN
ncbi:chemotaxis protein CheA [Geotalea sp. SG265]|uniref:chemotaxis protein CheA n=1 Tax=Geotalea sp. SG265 TaxID=2922867 RepID=UPI001FAF5BDA|nr:chemotaxis protein CheA [Geotalea sp. SG265]